MFITVLCVVNIMFIIVLCAVNPLAGDTETSNTVMIESTGH